MKPVNHEDSKHLIESVKTESCRDIESSAFLVDPHTDELLVVPYSKLRRKGGVERHAECPNIVICPGDIVQFEWDAKAESQDPTEYNRGVWKGAFKLGVVVL